uniref:ubiquitin-like domain-containing protein n=1 Tax=Streptobacillus canis TaxID=2678686 RepID=UPI0012E13F12
MHLDDGSNNINKKPRGIVNDFDVRELKKLIFENEKIEPKYQKLILGDTIIINDKKLKVSSIEDKKNG